uniref:Golgi-associated PDZ and coiled-coil motif-containing protein n=1 Tax=Phallusia mammillata TaxID=59560 RepID=A0A6F9DD64_9ASCI|nr:golgi-associated PDZ and coiled-coil motif-containing protein [Phallusia mammillata]
MAGSASIFHCLDVLEKEFDKAFVDLDVLLGEGDFEENEDLILDARDKMNTLSSCFSQLCHKTQTTAQTNAKLEADAINSREELLTARSNYDAAQLETSQLVRQLHTLQLQLHAANTGSTFDPTTIKQKLDDELETFRTEARNQTMLRHEINSLKQEKLALTKKSAGLESELYGARLAAKYLDKELAGRIQQIQLLGRNIKPPNFEKMWHQLEAEIHLHRHKTVIRACRGASKLSSPAQDKAISHQRHGVGDVRQVTITKGAAEGLGISITGGREHGVPILISEIHEGAVTDRTGGLYVGDAILSVNNQDLRHAKHQDAVSILSQQVEKLTLEVVYVTPDDDAESDDVTYALEIAGESQQDDKASQPSMPPTPTLSNDSKLRNGSSSLSDVSDAPKVVNGTSDPKSSDGEGHLRSTTS